MGTALGTVSTNLWVVQHLLGKARPGILGAVKSLEWEVSFSTLPLGRQASQEGQPQENLPTASCQGGPLQTLASHKQVPLNASLATSFSSQVPRGPPKEAAQRLCIFLVSLQREDSKGAQGSLGWIWGQAVMRVGTRRPPSSCGCLCSSGSI